MKSVGWRELRALRGPCPGSGAPAINVGRVWIGELLPMCGECTTCGTVVRISRDWTVLSHPKPLNV